MAKNIELHVHPFLGRENTITNVIEAMDKTGVDILALEALDDSVHNFVAEEIQRKFPKAYRDSCGIKLPDGKYLLRAREYNTKEKIHLLTIGYTMDNASSDTEMKNIIDNCLEKDGLVIIDHPFVDNARTRTAGHIDSMLEEKLTQICREYSGNIALEWNGYSIPWVRLGLKYALTLAGHRVKYHNINKKAEELSEKLKSEGYNVPIIADTDLHARKRRHLLQMGRARVISDVNGETPEDIAKSLKQNIFRGEYFNVKQYVSALHLFEAFCIPVLFSKLFYKPRA